MKIASPSPGVGEPKFANAADEKWGYPFGVSGLMNPESVRKFLGVSDRTLDRLVSERRIRRGRQEGSIYRTYCRRSVEEYAQRLEE